MNYRYSPEDYPPGEDPGDLQSSIAESVRARFASAKELAAHGHELVSGIIGRDGEEHELPADDIEKIETGQASGHFLLHMKDELSENKVKVIAVTGAALFACAALIRQRRKNN